MNLDPLADHLGAPNCLGCARSGSLVCGACRVSIVDARSVASVPNVDRVVAGWDYDGVARALVLALKLGGRRGAAMHLARGLAERVWERGLRAEALAWIPGRRRDTRRRGFDHAALIATSLSQLLGIPAKAMLCRTGDRADQAALAAAERRSNLVGAFSARDAPLRVASVDDLMTTGATLTEAGRALRAAGVAHVEGLVACSAS